MTMPKLRFLVRRLPSSWRMALIEALVWPEFNVTQSVYVWRDGPAVDRVPVFGLDAPKK